MSKSRQNWCVKEEDKEEIELAADILGGPFLIAILLCEVNQREKSFSKGVTNVIKTYVVT